MFDFGIVLIVACFDGCLNYVLLLPDLNLCGWFVNGGYFVSWVYMLVMNVNVLRSVVCRGVVLGLVMVLV